MHILSFSGVWSILIVITDNKDEWNEKKRKIFIHSKGALLQQITLFQKKKTEQPWVVYSFDLASTPSSESWAGEFLGSLEPSPRGTDWRASTTITGPSTWETRVSPMDPIVSLGASGSWPSSIPAAPEGLLSLANTSREVIVRAMLELAAATSSEASLTSELGLASSLMAGGYNTCSVFHRSNEASSPACLRASVQTWEQ